MLSAVRVYFENLSAWLLLLKYLGLCLAAGSSIWATLNVLTITASGGQKKLTAAGFVAIGFTVLGLIIGIVSDDLQRRSSAASQRAQIEAEAKRTNDIIVAGQRITSLHVDWKIRGLDDEASKQLEKGADEAADYITTQQIFRSGGQKKHAYRNYQLYPFLAVLAHRFVKPGKPDNENTNVVVLIALDDDYSAVLSFGFLQANDVWRPLPGGNKAVSPETIEFGTEYEDSHPKILNWPLLTSVGGNGVDLQWHIDPATFANAIHRQNEFVVPTSKLPNTLRLAILFNIKQLPFAPGNLALSHDQNFWNFPNYDSRLKLPFHGRVDLITKSFASSIQLIPNNSSIVSYDYDLKQVYETLFRDEYGQANGQIRCIVFQFERANR